MAETQTKPPRKRRKDARLPLGPDGLPVPEYIVWRSMRARCEREANPQYANYGGRGISVCDRWLGRDGFLNFLADMGARPSPDHTLDRIDNDGPYAPWNCRWATIEVQSRNMRRNVHVTCAGRTMVLKDWAIELGMPYMTLKARIRKGMDPAEAFQTPSGQLPPRASSGYRGVYRHPSRPRPWQAKISVGPKSISLGYYATPREAAAAYNEAAARLHGAAAALNNLD